MDILENVDYLTSEWIFDESIDDVKMQLEIVTNELDAARKQKTEQDKIYKENVQKLLHLLGIAYQERDEARDQLRKQMMIKPQGLPPLSPKTPMDSVFDVVSSPELSNPNRVAGVGHNTDVGNSSYDPGSVVIDNLAKGRPKPEKGKLLETVMKAGPLLTSLMVAGSLPRWQNPPQAMQGPQVPSVRIKGYHGSYQLVEMTSQAEHDTNRSTYLGDKGVSSSTYSQTFCGSSSSPTSSLQVFHASNLLNFENSSSGSCLMHNATGLHGQVTMGKRQRIV